MTLSLNGKNIRKQIQSQPCLLPLNSHKKKPRSVFFLKIVLSSPYPNKGKI